MSGTDDLIAFLNARLDEDEAVVRRNLGNNGLGDEGWFPDYQTYNDDDTHAANTFLTHFKPPRMLREVKAKREILEEHRPDGDTCIACHGVPFLAISWDGETELREWRRAEVMYPCLTVKAILAIYENHPDCPEAWRADVY